MTTVNARMRNSRGQGNLLREEILAAAASLVDSADMPTAFTLRGVARKAGVSAPSIYSHFADVQAIADAVLESSFAELDATVAAAIAVPDDPPHRLVAGCLAYVSYAWQHPRRYRFMVSSGGFAPDAVNTFDRVEGELRRCVDVGASTSRDPHSDAFLIWVGMHGMATLEKPGRPQLRRLGPLDRPALAEILVRRLAGLAPAREIAPLDDSGEPAR